MRYNTRLHNPHRNNFYFKINLIFISLLYDLIFNLKNLKNLEQLDYKLNKILINYYHIFY